MPYYIYKVFPFRRLEKVGELAAFKDASTGAKALRRELAGVEECQVKVIFAENELQAEDLLSQVREAEPLTGDDW